MRIVGYFKIIGRQIDRGHLLCEYNMRRYPHEDHVMLTAKSPSMIEGLNKKTTVDTESVPIYRVKRLVMVIFQLA